MISGPEPGIHTEDTLERPLTNGGNESVAIFSRSLIFIYTLPDTEETVYSDSLASRPLKCGALFCGSLSYGI
jgi:hypothetical protein|nr:MAG TPA: hypothetical protein [Caudoviricetes sp.]